jgi:hypothetical protein
MRCQKISRKYLAPHFLARLFDLVGRGKKVENYREKFHLAMNDIYNIYRLIIEPLAKRVFCHPELVQDLRLMQILNSTRRAA